MSKEKRKLSEEERAVIEELIEEYHDMIREIDLAYFAGEIDIRARKVMNEAIRADIKLLWQELAQ